MSNGVGLVAWLDRGAKGVYFQMEGYPMHGYR